MKEIKSFTMLVSRKKQAVITYRNGYQKVITINSTATGKTVDGMTYTVLWYWPTGNAATSKQEESVVCYSM